MNKRKSILLIGNYPLPWGGVPVHIASLSDFLNKQGWKVTVLSLAYSKKLNYKRVEEVGNITIHRPDKIAKILALFNLLFSKNGYFFIRNWINLGLTVKGIFTSAYIFKLCSSHKIDIVSAYHLWAGILAHPSKNHYKIPLIVTIFGEIYKETLFYQQLPKKTIHSIYDFDDLWSCSNHCGVSLSLLNVNKKVTTTYYGVNLNRFPNVVSLTSRDNTSTTLLFVGRMEEEMGLGILLSALPKILTLSDKLNVVIAGSKGVLTPNAIKFAETFPNQVKVITNLQEKDLNSLYLSCDAVLVPSTNARACFGLAIAEAGAAGKPVLASKIGGHVEVMIENETGLFFEPNNPDALFNCVKQFYRLSTTQQNLIGQKGLHHVRANFSEIERNKMIENILISHLPLKIILNT